MSDPRRCIPSVERLLASDAFEALLERTPRTLVARATQQVQEALRGELADGAAAPDGIESPAWFATRVAERLDALERPSLRPVINATGVVLHTNLGRAPLADAALAAVDRVARSYANLEYDLDEGRRGSRYDHCSELLEELTGAQAALVVNNNAAAVVLALNTLADGREAVISRGQLVEIGGSFRVPEIMAKSGARMVEVGATNRTHRRDYERAVGDRTGAILTVHRSNFRVTGFVADVPLRDLVEIGSERGVPVIDDLGSGLLLPPDTLGLSDEPTAIDAIRAGADVVTLSGDKLLGGPQAGLILGRAELVERMRRNPLCRALRVDKLTLAALEATLALYRDPEVAVHQLPALRMLASGADELEARAHAIADGLRARGIDATTRAGTSVVGGGAAPDAGLPTTLVVLDSADRSASQLERRLRDADPPVIARVEDDRVVLDPRTIGPGEVERLLDAIAGVLA